MSAQALIDRIKRHVTVEPYENAPLTMAEARELVDSLSEEQSKAEEMRVAARGWITEAETLRRSLAEAVSFQLASRNADTLDAERYRYLRNAAALDECGPAVWNGCSDLFDCNWGADVDEVVDEAMARWKAAGSPVPKETA